MSKIATIITLVLLAICLALSLVVFVQDCMVEWSAENVRAEWQQTGAELNYHRGDYDRLVRNHTLYL